MKANESGLDRIIRVLLGIALLVLNVAGVVTGTLGTIFIVVGVLALFTGALGFCPLYALLKIRTNKA